MMHEYSIVQSLVDSVAAAVGARKNTVVRSLRVSIGEVAGVDCGLLTTAYEVFRAGTLCENAAMTIDRIPARWECPLCGAAIVRGAVLQCPQCHEPAFMAAGDEIILQRVELEVA